MATIFIDPGGDSTFDTSLEPVVSGTVTIATDFVHGGHIKSYKFATGGSNWIAPSITVTDAGGRHSVWFYFNALPTGTTELIDLVKSGPGAAVAMVLMTSAGVILLGNGSTQLGSNGPTLTTGNWYRISFAWKITSTTVNQFLVTVGSATGTILGTIAVTNGTLTNTTSGALITGNFGGDATLDLRASDIYIDNSTAVTDPGNVWVTAKRPFANGTTNGFTTQIGAGGSGYGTGHAPQVNERPLSITNGWSMVGAGSAVTEEYTIEGLSVGDIDLTGATIVDFMGWVDVKALIAETGKIIVAGVSTNISVTTSANIFKQIAGSTTYPAGGTDIGVTTSTTVTTFSLYEGGIAVAYIPGVPTTTSSSPTLSLMGVG